MTKTGNGGGGQEGEGGTDELRLSFHWWERESIATAVAGPAATSIGTHTIERHATIWARALGHTFYLSLSLSCSHSLSLSLSLTLLPRMWERESVRTGNTERERECWGNKSFVGTVSMTPSLSSVHCRQQRLHSRRWLLSSSLSCKGKQARAKSSSSRSSMKSTSRCCHVFHIQNKHHITTWAREHWLSVKHRGRSTQSWKTTAARMRYLNSLILESFWGLWFILHLNEWFSKKSRFPPNKRWNFLPEKFKNMHCWSPWLLLQRVRYEAPYRGHQGTYFGQSIKRLNAWQLELQELV